MLMSELHLDGNAAAGPLRELFAIDVTAARATCLGCDEERPVGALLAYGQPTGLILRCPGCDTVMLCVVRTPARLTLTATGVARLVVDPASHA